MIPIYVGAFLVVLLFGPYGVAGAILAVVGVWAFRQKYAEK